MPRSLNGAAFGASLTALFALVGALLLTLWDDAGDVPRSVLQAGEAVVALAGWAATSTLADHDTAPR